MTFTRYKSKLCIDFTRLNFVCDLADEIWDKAPHDIRETEKLKKIFNKIRIGNGVHKMNAMCVVKKLKEMIDKVGKLDRPANKTNYIL